ncbi:Hemicentin-1 [Temnothorax longispinosus]|uniref:Hemicentin-1 n=1 Tax=Temnothorax longispinosus TaxID=300112 RepID=A0A4S2JD73_9HYME|nr:Hemicentin-1 [Temnothorax longispinosus]
MEHPIVQTHNKLCVEKGYEFVTMLSDAMQPRIAPAVFMNLQEGRYDLQIRNVSYERDNGKYECRAVSYTHLDVYKRQVEKNIILMP